MSFYVKLLAIATVLASIPLLLSFNIKYEWFPPGIAYATLFFAGLVSVFVTPVLLIIGFLVMIWIAKSSDVSRKSLLRWNLAAIAIGSVAELVFVAARHSAP